MTSWRLWVPGEPRPTGNKGETIRLPDGRVFQKKRHPEYIARILSFAMDAHPGHPLKGPLRITITAYRMRPKSLKKSVRYPETRPDWDGYAKGLCDALQGIVYRDDSTIVEGTVRKAFADERGPGVDILVEEME